MLLGIGSPVMSQRYSCLIITLVVVALCFHLFRTSRSWAPQPVLGHGKILTVYPDEPAAEEAPATAEGQYLSRLKRYGLSKEVKWLTWRVQHVEKWTDWNPVADVALDFLTNQPGVVNTADDTSPALRAKAKMELPVAMSSVPGTIDASELLFGVATNYQRLVANDLARIKMWARFLTNGHRQSNGATLVVLLEKASASQVEEVDKYLEVYGIDAYIASSDGEMSMPQRYMELAKILTNFDSQLAVRNQEKFWYALIEDTIFFPNLSYLLDRLSGYNSDRENYVGLPSERADWIASKDGITTSGGGAVFMTQSLVKELPKLPCFGDKEMPMPRVLRRNWDNMLQDCLMRQKDLKLHAIPSFYSPIDDVPGSFMESYETGMQPLILKQADERHGLDANMAHKVTNVCGEACFMQRYVFRDRFVLINGVEIVEYPKDVRYSRRGTSPRSMVGGKTNLYVADELILDSPPDDWAVLDYRGHKKVWRLYDSVSVEDGSVYQAYVNKAEGMGGKEEDDMDSVIVLIWEDSKPKSR
jgi:hypothetical protein